MNADYIDDGDDYESDDYGDIIDAEVIEDTPEISPEVQAYLDENGGWNRDQLHALHENMMRANQNVTAFWNELSDTTRRAWKNLIDGFGQYYGAHAGTFSSMGSDVQEHIYTFIGEYLRLKKLVEREISALRARMHSTGETAQPASQPQARTQPQRAATPRTTSRARNSRLPTTASTSSAFQDVASGFSIAKLLPWVLLGGVAWYVYTNRKELFRSLA